MSPRDRWLTAGDLLDAWHRPAWAVELERTTDQARAMKVEPALAEVREAALRFRDLAIKHGVTDWMFYGVSVTEHPGIDDVMKR